MTTPDPHPPSDASASPEARSALMMMASLTIEAWGAAIVVGRDAELIAIGVALGMEAPAFAEVCHGVANDLATLARSTLGETA